MFFFCAVFVIFFALMFCFLGLGGGIGRSGLGLTVDNPGSGRYRATAESVLVWHLMKHLKRSLKEEGIFQTFQETEMPVVCIISRMELNGIGKL